MFLVWTHNHWVTQTLSVTGKVEVFSHNNVNTILQMPRTSKSHDTIGRLRKHIVNIYWLPLKWANHHPHFFHSIASNIPLGSPIFLAITNIYQQGLHWNVLMWAQHNRHCWPNSRHAHNVTGQEPLTWTLGLFVGWASRKREKCENCGKILCTRLTLVKHAPAAHIDPTTACRSVRDACGSKLSHSTQTGQHFSQTAASHDVASVWKSAW